LQSDFLGNSEVAFFLYTLYSQFTCNLFAKFALENARNTVLELQKGKNFLGEDPQTPLFSSSLMVVFKTDFSFKISLVCSSKWIHEITYSLFLIFWHQVCEVIYPLKSKNKKAYDL
jgi:hypothetical protein